MEAIKKAFWYCTVIFTALGTVCRHASAEAALALQLQLQFSNARLPLAVMGARAVYDGDDTIYIIGGSGGNDGEARHILKYSISADRLEEFGEFLPRYAGAAILYEQDLIYLGDDLGNLEVTRYSIVTQTYRVVNGLPRRLFYTAFAWDPVQEFLYLFGGTNAAQYHDEIFRYNPRDDHIQWVGQLPEPLLGAAAMSNGNGSGNGQAFIFPERGSHVLEYNPANGIVTRGPAIPSLYGPCAIMSESGHGYVFAQGTWLRYDSNNRNVEEYVVRGWGEIYDATCAYVRSLDRIYIFGGYGRYPGTTDAFRDEIAYIDLGNFFSEP